VSDQSLAAQFRAMRDQLAEHKKQLEAELAEINSIIGDVPKPKRGRPRGSRSKPEPQS
jgi:hypothetical protein